MYGEYRPLRVFGHGDPIAAWYFHRLQDDLPPRGGDRLGRGLHIGHPHVGEPGRRARGVGSFGRHAAQSLLAESVQQILATWAHIKRAGLFPSEKLAVEGERRRLVGSGELMPGEIADRAFLADFRGALRRVTSEGRSL